MTRSVLVFGNGLGMAVDSQYFQLAEGLAAAWGVTDTFTENHKRLIGCAIPGVVDEIFLTKKISLTKCRWSLLPLAS